MGVSIGPSIITDGLVLYVDSSDNNSYPGSGDIWEDLSGNCNDGILINTPTYISDNNGVLRYNGSNEYANVGDNSILSISDNITISSWVRLTILGSYYGVYGGSNQSGAPRRGATLGKWSDNKWCLFVGKNDATYWTLLADDVAVINTWYYVTGVVDNGTMHLYINDIKQTSTTSDVILYSTDKLSVIGRWYGDYNGFYYNGDIPIVKVYNKALTQSEINRNFNAQKSRFGL